MDGDVSSPAPTASTSTAGASTSIAGVKQETATTASRAVNGFSIGQDAANKEQEHGHDGDYGLYDDYASAAEAAPPSGDLYLDTINRNNLDFDFERLCSVSLSNINIYACLVCGKYFQGRGKSSHAYAHSIHDDHHVFINLQTLKVYVLPDLYEVNDPSLQDIRYLLAPTFTPKLLRELDAGTATAYTLNKQPYKPGYVGLNNIKANSYMNVVIQALLHVQPLRDYFIFHSQPHPPKQKATSATATAPAISTMGDFDHDSRSELVKRFGMLARKFWNPKNFKSQVSPHEFLQEVTAASNKKFKITEQGDPADFLSWLLNALHRDLGGTRKPNSSIIYSIFQGELRMQDQQIQVKTGAENGEERTSFNLNAEIKTTKSPFLFLAIDLPPIRVFQESTESNNIIPQVPISEVLAKFNGHTTQESAGRLRQYKLTKLPPFVIMHIKRFTSNNFVEEKNPTIVNFPLKGVDMSECIDSPPDDPSFTTMYNLVANITHESTAGTAHEDTKWKVHVHTRQPPGSHVEEDWYQIQDLIVEEINKQMVFLGESYIQIWERQLPPGKTHHDIRIDASSANLRQKTTKALTAAANLKNQAAEGAVVQTQAPQKVGTFAKNSFKQRRERGDSGIDI